MASVTFPDGSRRPVELVDRAAAERRLKQLLKERAEGIAPEKGRQRQATFREVFDLWFREGCPTVRVDERSRTRRVRRKDGTTVDVARLLMDNWVYPDLGNLRVDSTSTVRVEALFHKMDKAGKATATIDKTFRFVNTAVGLSVRRGLVKTNPVADAMTPEAKPAADRKAVSEDQAIELVTKVIPASDCPAMWMVGLMCGLRPGELTGLRWCNLELDDRKPYVKIWERAHYQKQAYVEQREPKKGSKRTIELPPLAAAALLAHKRDQERIGRYRYIDEAFASDGFVFPTRDNRPQRLGHVRKKMGELFATAKIEGKWTTYELRHSCVTLGDSRVFDLQKMADVAGHRDTKTTLGYRHIEDKPVPHAVEVWDAILAANDETRKEGRSDEEEEETG